MKKKVYKISKWFHKYLGLVLILFLIWESLSGILMNHPELISSISVPKWLVPSHYHIKNWNRSSLIKIEFSKKDSLIGYLCGKQGVWKTIDGGKNYKSFMEGYSTSPFYYKTSDIFLYEKDSTNFLIAASNEGFFINKFINDNWRKIYTSEELEAGKKILLVDEEIVLVSESNIYKSKIGKKLNFEKVNLLQEGIDKEVTLVDLFFHLHDGRVWGLPGRLLFDVVGLIIFILSISAFNTWYFPKMLKRKREKKIKLRNVEKKVYRFLFKYHLKLGIWSSVIVLIIATTGFFMRPPMLAAIANGSISSTFYPGPLDKNPWHKKIQNALFDSKDSQIILQTTHGLYKGNANFTEKYVKEELNIPIFVMGATVFESESDTDYVVGSFNGIYSYSKEENTSYNILLNEYAKDVSNVRPADIMITGKFNLPNGEEYITAHDQGIVNIKTSKVENFILPKELINNYKMPLWNYLFEIHNGRFFKFALDKFYILLVPLCSLFFIIITITGIVDWFIIKKR